MKLAVGTGGPSAGATVAAATGGLTIERLVAVDSPREFRIHPRDRVVVCTQEQAGARQVVVLLAAGRQRGPDHGVREGRRRPAMVARRPPPRLHPGRRDPDRRRRRQPRRARRQPSGRRLDAALVARRAADRVPLAAPGLDPGQRRRRPGAAAWSPGSRAAAPRAADPDGHRLRRRGLRVVGRRRDDRRGDVPRPGVRGERDPPRRRRERRRAKDRRRRQGVGVRAAGRARWRVPLPVGRRRLVPGRPGRRRRPRENGSHDRQARARRADRLVRLRCPAVAGWQPLRPRRHPRRADRPRRRPDRRGHAGQARPRPARRRTRRRPSPPAPARSSTRGPASGARSGSCADGAWLAAIGESQDRPQDLWLLPGSRRRRRTAHDRAR